MARKTLTRRELLRGAVGSRLTFQPESRAGRGRAGHHLPARRRWTASTWCRPMPTRLTAPTGPAWRIAGAGEERAASWTWTASSGFIRIWPRWPSSTERRSWPSSTPPAARTRPSPTSKRCRRWSGRRGRQLHCQRLDQPSPGQHSGPLLARSRHRLRRRAAEVAAGRLHATAVRSLTEFRLPPDAWRSAPQFRASGRLLRGRPRPRRSRWPRNALELLQSLEKLDPDTYKPEGGRGLPETDLGRGLQQIAQLIKADVGWRSAPWTWAAGTPTRRRTT